MMYVMDTALSRNFIKIKNSSAVAQILTNPVRQCDRSEVGDELPDDYRVKPILYRQWRLFLLNFRKKHAEFLK